MSGDCQHKRFDIDRGRCMDCGRTPDQWADDEPRWVIEPIPLAMIIIGVALIIVGFILMAEAT